MTFYRYLKKFNQNVHLGMVLSLRLTLFFFLDMEKDLVAHIKLLGDHYHGLRRVKCKELAYEFALHNNLAMKNVLLKNFICSTGDDIKPKISKVFLFKQADQRFLTDKTSV